MADGTAEMSFWDHLEALRGTLLKTVAAALLCAVAAFFFKDQLFAVVLAPKNADFVTYRLFDLLAEHIPFLTSAEEVSVRLINTGLATQFAIHVKISAYTGLLLASPYILVLLFRFVSPALYERERRCSVWVAGGAYVMFFVGALVNYLLIFPFTIRFLGTYQVSAEVENLISLTSYIDTLLTMSLMLGILFELPVVSWLLGRFGLLSRGFMRRYRRHAVVVILFAAAVITPTTDIFTLLVTALPVWLLYELSTLLVPVRNKVGTVEK